MLKRTRQTDPAALEATVTELHATELTLAREILDIARLVDSFDSSLGRDAALDAILAGADAAGQMADARTAARARVEVLDQAIEAARARRIATIDDHRAAQVARLRAEAAAKHADADRRQKRTDELLAELTEHEDGARFVPYRPPAVASGAYADPEQFVRPLTERIRAEANGIEQQANILERTLTQAADSATAATVDELLAGIAERSPFVLAPRLDHVAAWARRARTVAEDTREGRGATPAQLAAARTTFEAVWNAGTLDENRSTVRLAVPDEADLEADDQALVAS